MQEGIEKLKEILGKAKKIAVLTGAGISAESGVPTFRGKEGMWRNHDPMELATPQSFARDPELVWEFYNWRRELLSKVQYNPAHKALAELEQRVPAFTLVTQNVDGLHKAAGSRNVIEIHGSIWKLRCTQCGNEYEDRTPNLGPLPQCDCSGLLRPGVVWFNEQLDQNQWQQAVHDCVNCDVLLVIGTSAVVQPAASLAPAAKQAGAVTAEINLEATPQAGSMDFAFQGKAGELVPLLVDF